MKTTRNIYMCSLLYITQFSNNYFTIFITLAL